MWVGWSILHNTQIHSRSGMLPSHGLMVEREMRQRSSCLINMLPAQAKIVTLCLHALLEPELCMLFVPDQKRKWATLEVGCGLPTEMEAKNGYAVFYII